VLPSAASREPWVSLAFYENEACTSDRNIRSDVLTQIYSVRKSNDKAMRWEEFKSKRFAEISPIAQQREEITRPQEIPEAMSSFSIIMEDDLKVDGCIRRTRRSS